MDYSSSSSSDSDSQRVFSQARSALSDSLSGGRNNINSNSSNNNDTQNHNNNHNNNINNPRNVNFNTTTLSNHRTVESGYDTTFGGGYSSSGRRRLPCRMKTIHKPKFEYHQTDAEIRQEQLKVMKAYGYIETKEHKAARIAFEATQYSSDDEKQMEARRERAQDRRDTAAARVAALGVRERVQRAASKPAVVTSHVVVGTKKSSCGKRGTKNNNTTSGTNVNTTTTITNNTSYNTTFNNTTSNSSTNSITNSATISSTVVVVTSNAEPDLTSVPAVVAVVVPSVVHNHDDDAVNVSESTNVGGELVSTGSSVNVDISSSSSSSSSSSAAHNVSFHQHTTTSPISPQPITSNAVHNKAPSTVSVSGDLSVLVDAVFDTPVVVGDGGSVSDVDISTTTTTITTCAITSASNTDMPTIDSAVLVPSLCVLDCSVSGSGDCSGGSSTTQLIIFNNNDTNTTNSSTYIYISGGDNNMNVNNTQDSSINTTNEQQPLKIPRKQTPTIFEKQKRHLLQQEYPSRRNAYSGVQSQQTELLDRFDFYILRCVLMFIFYFVYTVAWYQESSNQTWNKTQ
jgi:hypothetical protein